MIFALVFFITAGDGEFSLSPVEYHYTAQACEGAKAKLDPIVEPMRRQRGWRSAFLSCIPIRPAANLPGA